MHIVHLNRRSIEFTRSSRYDGRRRAALGEQMHSLGRVDERDRLRTGSLQRGR
jgi:hypothetical protein